MKRETFKFKDEELIEQLFNDDDPNSDFEFIEENQTYYDTEKGCSDYRVIVKRKSDGKYFEGNYTKWPAGGSKYDMEIEEVFPKKITKTIYE